MVNPSYYQQFFDQIEHSRRLYTGYKDVATDMDNKLNELKEQINVVFEKLDEFGEALNKNKFKYGLKGQIKKFIRTQREIPEMTEEQQHAFEQPYAQTPFERGGKRRRKTKRVKSKRRKTRKH